MPRYSAMPVINLRQSILRFISQHLDSPATTWKLPVTWQQPLESRPVLVRIKAQSLASARPFPRQPRNVVRWWTPDSEIV